MDSKWSTGGEARVQGRTLAQFSTDTAFPIPRIGSSKRLGVEFSPGG